MSEVETTTETETEATPKPEILRGRMPLPLVRTIKFGHADLNDSQVADMYRTTSGKVSDIRKGRNFGYVGEDNVAFTEEQIEAAKARIAELPDAAPVEAAMEAAGIKVGSEEEISAFEESRAGSRKKRGEAEAEPTAGETTEEDVQEEADAGEASDDGLDDLLS